MVQPEAPLRFIGNLEPTRAPLLLLLLKRRGQESGDSGRHAPPFESRMRRLMALAAAT